MHYYSLPLSGAIAIGSVLATGYPVNSNASAPWMHNIPEPNANIHGRPSGVVVPNVAPPPPSPANPAQYQPPVAPARPVVSPTVQGSSPMLSREQYRQVVSGAATVEPGLYRVDWGLQTSVMALFADTDDGSTQMGFSVGRVPQRYQSPEQNWYGQVTARVQREAEQSVYEREQRWQGYGNTLRQFFPGSEPEPAYDPQAPYVPQDERSRNSGCYWQNGMQFCG